MRLGFSLVELSIVLVILGLLTGGILAGQSLVRASEVRSVAVDLKRFQSAMYTFRDRYLGWPGDITNATGFWGIAGGAGTGTACYDVSGTTTATCDGSGDGYINMPTGISCPTVSCYGERFHAWKQLANAGLIEGTFTGKTDSAMNQHTLTPGLNVPASRLPNAGYTTFGAVIGSGLAFSNMATPPLRMITLRPVTGGGAPLRPEEAWNIDTKMDDGRPAFGKVTHFKKTSTTLPNCVTSDDPALAEYDVTSPDKLCGMDLMY